MAEKKLAIRSAQADDRLHFVQVQRTALRALSALALRSPRAASLLIWMVEQMDRRGALVASRRTMARALGCHENTVTTALRVLEAERWVQRISLGPGTVSAFAINSRVAWSGERAAMTRLAHFTAHVVAHRDDQTAATLSSEPLRAVPEIIPPEVAAIAEDADDSPETQLDLLGI